jgi:competence protein ComEC
MINLRRTSSLIAMALFVSLSTASIEARAVDKEKGGQVVSSQGTADNTSNTDDGQVNKKQNTEKTATKDKENVEEDNDKEVNSNNENTTDENNSEEEVAQYQWLKVHDKLFYYVNGKPYNQPGWFNEHDVNPEADENKLYYIEDDGTVAVGWKQFADKWYYFDENGVMLTGWQQINNAWYYLNKYGEMKQGWIEENGDKYYLYDSGNMAIGKKYIDGNWYRFGQSGKLLIGRYYNNGKIFYSNKDGVMVSDKWISINGNDYYVKTDSSLAVGETIINNKLEVFDETGKHIETKDLGKDYLFVKQLDVGDADCAFIRLPNGETVLIDTGTPESSEKLVNFLKEQNLKKSDDKYVIDNVIITHGHSDHIGGLKAVLENFEVNKVYLPTIARMQNWAAGVKETEENKEQLEMLRYDYDVYKDAVNAMNENDMEFTPTVKGEYIDSENILQFVQSDYSFGPVGPDKLTADYWGINDNSAIVYLNHGDFQMLFTGDMEWTSERQFIYNNLLGGREVDVLKVGHHGNDTSSTGNFIAYVKAPIGIISRAKESVTENRAYKDLINGGVSIYETSSNDGVSIYATKENWTFGTNNLENK